MKNFFKDKLYFSILCLAILAGLILTYSNHFNNPFDFDDAHTIVNNVWIRDVKNIPEFFVDGTTSSSLPSNQAYRPGVTALNTIDYAISKKNPFNIGENKLYPLDKGLKPFYFHLSIFISYILQAIVMFFLLKKIFVLSFKHRWSKYFALFATSFYCYHTANAETINYVSARSDSFSTLMVMLALVIFIYFPGKRKFYFYLLPFILGFFVKEPALMFIPILFIYVALFEEQIDFIKIFDYKNIQKIIKTFKILIVPLVLAVVLLMLNFKMQSKTFMPSTISKSNYLITQPFVIVQYFKTFFLPTELSADTDWQPLSSALNIKFFMGIIFITGMLWLALRFSKKIKYRPVTFGILWFFLALLPTSSIISLSEVLNDHRIFFPNIGLTLAFSTIFISLFILSDEKRFNNSLWLKSITGIIIILLLAGHAYGTRQRNRVWSSDETLWYDVTQKSPENGRGHMNYGLALMRSGNYMGAKTSFEKALKLAPYYSLVHINLGILHSALNDKKTAEQYFKNAISIGTYIDQGYFYYGNFLYNSKRYFEAEQMLTKSISINPTYTEPRFALMALYNETQDWEKLAQLANETILYLPNDAMCLAYIDTAKNKKTKP